MDSVNTHHSPHGDILVVDDDMSDLKFLSGFLEEAGYTVRPASDGELALRSVQAKLPALILLDVNMPDLDGYEVCRRLKDSEDTRDIPVIFISVKTSPIDKVKAFGVGGADYISKPFEPEEVLARVATHLALWKAQKRIEEKNLQLQQEIAERKRAEEALRESEERYRGLFERVPVGLYRTTPDGQILDANPAMAGMLGYPNREALCAVNAIEDYANPEDREHWKAIMERDGIVRDFEVQARRRDGTIIWVHESARTVRNAHGRVLYYEGSLEDVTRRKRAEKLLELEKKRLSMLLETFPGYIYLQSPDYSVRYANRYFVEHFGEPKGRLCYEVLWGRKEPCEVCPTFEVFDAKTPRVWEWSQTPDGRVYLIYDHPFIDSNGSELVLEIGVDITERKRAEEAVEERNRELTALYEVALATSATLEVDELLKRIYEQVGQLVNFDAFWVALVDEERGELRFEITTEEGKPLPKRTRKAEARGSLAGWVVHTRKPFLIRDWDREKDALPTVTHQVGRPVQSWLGIPLLFRDRVVGVMAVQSFEPHAFDEKEQRLLTIFANQMTIAIENARLYQAAQQEITERKRTEEALRESEEKYRTILENIEDGYYEVDLAGNLTFFNDSLCKMLGCSPDEMMGLNNREFMDDETARLVYQTFNEVYRTGEPAKAVDWDLIREDGDKRLVEASVSLIRDPTGKPTGFRGVARDLTERKRAEERMWQQERLAAVGQLAGGIAHDFNNLLTTIILHAQISLGKPDLPPDLARSFETILGESRKAAELVQQILDFSRHAMIEVRPLDLASFTEEVIGILRRMIPENMHLTLTAGVKEYVVEADPTRIQQVLMNLATNGRDAMPEGGELRFELSRMQLKPDEEPPVVEMKPGEWVCLAVSDTGMGMTEEVRAHLFEPFFTTKEVGKGTGLGLAQVYGIVRQHEGYIGVETEVGKGTTFRIYLPACGAGEESAEEVTATPRGKGETILLVEDDEKLRAGGRGLLESLGYRVLTAADGRKALEVYQTAEEVDLVITDLVMPEMGGQQLVHELRQATLGLKALAITGYVMREDLEGLKYEGFLDVVHKPFDVDALAQAVRRALDED